MSRITISLEADTWADMRQQLAEALKVVGSAAVSAQVPAPGPTVVPAPVAAPTPPQPSQLQAIPGLGGFVCSIHGHSLKHKEPKEGQEWPAGFYCPERGCRVMVLDAAAVGAA